MAWRIGLLLWHRAKIALRVVPKVRHDAGYT